MNNNNNNKVNIIIRTFFSKKVLTFQSRPLNKSNQMSIVHLTNLLVPQQLVNMMIKHDEDQEVTLMLRPLI